MHINYKKYLIVVCLCIHALGLSAEEPKQAQLSLSLRDAISRALQSSDDLKISKERINQLHSTYKEVRASVFPQISGSFSWNRYIESPVLSVDMGGGANTFKLKQDWEMGAGVTLSQVLWAFGKVFTAIEIAQKAMDVQDLLLQATRNELIFGVKQAYLTTLYAQESVRIAQESHENAIKNQKALAERYRGGRISRMSNVKMEADVAMRVPMVLNAKAGLETVAINFKNVLNIERAQEVILSERFTESFPEFRFSDAKNTMIAQEPTLGVLRKNIALQESIVKLRKVGYYPTLGGFMSYNYTGNSNDVVPADAMQSEVVAGVQLRMTLFDYGALKHKYSQAKNDNNIAQIEYNKQSDALEAQLDATITEYYADIQTYQANLRAQKLTEDAYAITLSSFKAGAVSESDLNDAELRLTSAKLATLGSLYKINVLIAKIEKFIAHKEEGL